MYAVISWSLHTDLHVYSITLVIAYMSLCKQYFLVIANIGLHVYSISLVMHTLVSMYTAFPWSLHA